MLIIKTQKQIVKQIVECSVLVAELTDRLIDPKDDILTSAIINAITSVYKSS